MLRDLITVRVKIDAPPEVVWRFLTVARDTWWPEMRFDAVVGAPLVETWIEEDRQVSATGSITLCAPPHLLGFKWIEARWDHSLEVVIRLDGAGRSTSIVLTETGFIRAGVSPSLPREHEEGWGYHLARLKRASEDEAIEADTR